MSFAPILLLATAVSLASPVKQGVDAWKAGDYAKAVLLWTDPAAKGDADAQFNLGQASKLGRGVPLDMRRAESWYRRAADQGHKQATAMLGLVMFQNGDRKGAMRHLRTAADDGDPRAQYVYGTALFNGDEVPRDYPRAYAMMGRAAAAGLPQAQAALRQIERLIPPGDRQAGLALAGAMRAAPAAAPQERADRVPGPPATDAPLPPRLPPAIPRPALAATPAVARGWQIQLGAFSSGEAARAAWSALSARPGMTALTAAYPRAGTVIRLRAGRFATRAAAARACGAAGVAGCFVVAE